MLSRRDAVGPRAEQGGPGTGRAGNRAGGTARRKREAGSRGGDTAERGYGSWVARAVIIGGTGAIGRAAARRLLATGWSVELTGRDPARMPRDIARAGGRFIAAGTHDAGRLRAAFGDGADLLVDCACFTAQDAAALLPLARDAASTVLISSKAVYVDAAGRHSNSPVKPDFGGPVREDQATVAPGAGDYRSAEGYPAGKVAAEQVLLDSGAPVTVLRPSKIHGPGSRQPREWMFVKRVLDRRPVLFLAHRGAGVDHPTAAANIAALIDLAAAQPGRRILNAADPDAPSALEISRIIARHLGHTWDEVLLDDEQAAAGQLTLDQLTLDQPASQQPALDQPALQQPALQQPALGRHPWDRPHPVVLDMTAAARLGYTPAGDYAATVAAEVDWLITAAQGGEDADLIPRPADEYFAPLLDYLSEDRWLAAQTASAG
jgi:nucleoside-diphosphate-sugar epimerase